MPGAGNIREIRRQIRGVGNIKKITRAMQMVSAAKLRKVQERLMTIRPYADKIQELLEHLSGQVREMNHPLFVPREDVRNVAYILLMGDKGMCGSYNSNMMRHADKFIKKKNLPYQAMAVGRKAVEYVERKKATITERYVQMPADVPFSQIQRMTRNVVDLYTSGEVDEVHFLFTRYVNAMTFTPGSARFLPIEPPAEQGNVDTDYYFEPEPKKILDQLVPRYIEVTFHRLLLESFSSEHAARMNAMQNATNNAQEMIDSLRLTYNKARQAAITKDLLDIVGGTEALSG